MKTTIITGAGTGIGAATAQRLAGDGHAIVLLGRRQAALDEVLATLPGEGHVAQSANVADRSSLHEALHGGVLDGRDVVAVFANAGIGGVNEYGPDDRWDDIIGVNLTGSYNTAMECLPFLRASDAPNRQILFTSSCLSRFGVPNYTAYCASKAAMAHHGHARQERRNQGIPRGQAGTQTPRQAESASATGDHPPVSRARTTL